MGTDTAAVLRPIYEAYARGDMPTVFGALAEDVDWTSECRGGLPWGGCYSGAAGVTAYFERVSANIEIEEFEVQEIIAQGDRAAVLTRVTARLRSTGQAMTLPKVDLVTVRDGKIASFSEFYDTATVVAATSSAGGMAAAGAS